uniref:Uncharacterized protein n=1 Tax=Panagrolaimus sp. JU765 TaxID=591449 RepID=A0AC34QAJ4_9BILA
MVDIEIIEKSLLEEQQNIRELEEQLFNEKNALKSVKINDSGEVEEQMDPQADFEKIVKISELETMLFLKKQNALKLQSQKNRLLNPVSLCPDLYLDVLLNVAGHHVRDILRFHGNLSLQFGKRQIMLNVIKFGLSGKENMAALVQMFEQHATTLNFREKYIDWLVQMFEHATTSDSSCDALCFEFEIKWTKFDLYHCELLGDWLVQLVKVATPNVTKIEFGEEKWCDLVFDVLSKDSRQKKLKMIGLCKLDDTVKTVLQNLVEKGVRIKLDDVDKETLMQLPPIEFDTLSTKNIFLLPELKCKFRRLKFIYLDWNRFSDDLGEGTDKLKIAFVKELCFKYPDNVGYFPKFFAQLKETFPNAEKLVVKHELTDSYGYSEMAFFIICMKEFIEEAPQNEIILTLCFHPVDRFSCLIRKLNFTKIAKNIFQCKSGVNENKIIRLKIPDYDDSDSDDDDADYDSSDFDDDDIILNLNWDLRIHIFEN